jgi:hypothetical protein
MLGMQSGLFAVLFLHLFKHFCIFGIDAVPLQSMHAEATLVWMRQQMWPSLMLKL